jgi:CRP/FNR family transcriptional regulator, dissimilatory nitrate respiration regulator
MMVHKLSLAGGGEVPDGSTMNRGAGCFDSLRQHYLFSGLDQGDFDTLANCVSEIRVRKGDILFHQGDRAAYFYFVDSGQLELNLVAPTGQKKVLEVIGPERTFAEAVTFMRGHKYPVTCEVLSDSVLYRIPNEDYVNLIQHNPDACMRLLGDISRHLHARVREIERLTVQNARDRLVSYLLEHIVETRDDEATIRVQLPRHVIASRLSITPETLSRLLRNLVDERILTIEDRVIFVHSLSRLRPYD